MPGKPKFVNPEQTDNAGQAPDPEKSFVIRQRNGNEWTVLVSECDYERVMLAGPWHVVQTNKKARGPYVQRRSGKSDEGESYLHRFIIPGVTRVDHINGDRLDNRRSNLRPASASQNNCNAPLRVTNTSGHKGVEFSRGRWRARIGVGGRIYWLGSFSSLEDAAFAYQGAALLLHGSFARFE